MENLPDLVKAALISACNSGKSLSWKVQESERGTLIQLVWKPRLESQDPALGSNWNSVKFSQTRHVSESESKRKRVTPSRARRNARRLQAFLERKRTQNAPRASEISPDHSGSSMNQQQVCTHTAVDTELKSLIDKEVDCVDFRLDNGEPVLDLELKNGDILRKPVDVKRPVRTYSQAHKSTMTLEELSGMDSIVFQMHESDDVPGLLLKKGQHCTWTPVSSRTRSRTKIL